MTKIMRPNVEEIKQMEKLLNVASDFTRLKILFALMDESKCDCLDGECCYIHCKNRECLVERSVNEIVELTECSQSLISHQLRKLRDYDLVRVRKDGTKVYYSLSDGHIKELLKVVYEHVLEEMK